MRQQHHVVALAAAGQPTSSGKKAATDLSRLPTAASCRRRGSVASRSDYQSRLVPGNVGHGSMNTALASSDGYTPHQKAFRTAGNDDGFGCVWLASEAGSLDA